MRVEFLLRAVFLRLFRFFPLLKKPTYDVISVQLRANNQGSPGDTLLVLKSQAPSFKILAVPNSVVFCNSPILTLISNFSLNPSSSSYSPHNTSKSSYNNRYCIHVFYTPHSSNRPLQILIIFYFFKFLFMYPTISRDSNVRNYTFFSFLLNYYYCYYYCFDDPYDVLEIHL